jgi:hypothetical protein
MAKKKSAYIPFSKDSLLALHTKAKNAVILSRFWSVSFLFIASHIAFVVGVGYA